jgi:hypothetical protein
METIVIIGWIALIIALAGAGVVAATDAWKRVQPDHERLSRGGNV